MAPVAEAMARGWPDAEVANILDDTLSRDRAAAPELTPELAARIVALADYARDLGANAILYTCSAFGTAIETAAEISPVPVFKPNQAMFDAALARGQNIAMVYTFAPALAGMEAEFHDACATAELTSVYAEGAMAALQAGDVSDHNRLVAEAVASIQNADTIMLAHFSTSRAMEAAAAAAATDIPVLSAPDAAVAALRQALG